MADPPANSLTILGLLLRSAFLGYLQEAEGIRRKPRFYNTLTRNCTTTVFDLARQLVPGLPMDYRLLLSGLTGQAHGNAVTTMTLSAA